ncbi:NAD-dependent dehydratase [Bifidobacterium aemilianum]|uniref:NAD-dependent dehydratase n=1 Tax=Bifidobacterium aemilianum TaxID=2493120 RepID=A0A366K9T5_9BIFI|nr:SDR family oxidoreductase [Bifidobacterium aemilianum]RBP98515.1 NAD-dependent dehydratase [Bifidobacterium aemilianum]
MKVIVVGATGRVGQLTCEALRDKGYEVVAFARHPESLEAREHMEARKLDLHESISQIAKAFAQAKADAIVFTAGSRGKDIVQVDAFGAIKTIDAAKKAGIKRYVMLGAMYAADISRWEDPKVKSAIDGLPDYYVTKFVADEHLLNSGLDYTIIEPGTLVETPATGHINAQPGQSGSISIADVAQALAQSLELAQSVGRVYDIIGGDEPIAQALRS